MSIELKYSVIIPTYNRSKTLALTLDSVCNQTLSPQKYEIIVVNDGSTDNTKEVVLNFQKKYPHYNIRYLYEQNGGVAKARNLGVKSASGEIIFFTDDDCVVPSNWMETLLDGYIRYPDVLGVGGWHKPANKNLAKMYFQRYTDFKQSMTTIPLSNNEVRTNIFFRNYAGNTSNMSYKKEVFLEIGGFDENLYFTGAIDWEFKMRVQNSGYYLLYLPIFVSHFKKLSFFTFVKKHFNQGRGKYYMSLKYHNDYKFFNVDQTINYLFFYFFYKTRFFPAHFLLCVSMLAGKIFICTAKPFKNIKLFNKDAKKNEYEIIRRYVPNNIIFATRFFYFIKNQKYSGAERFFPENQSQIQYSVVVPTYNRQKNILRALESLVKQTISQSAYEIIIVDDGSTDATKATVEEFQNKYSQNFIRYFFQNNAGPASARNKGIKESRGKIIFFY